MPDKLNDLAFVNYVSSFDFVCLTETFTDSGYDYENIFRDHLKYFAPARKFSHHGRNSGGVLVLVKKCLEPYITEIKLDCDNAITLKLNKEVFGFSKDLVFVASYVVNEGGPLYDHSEIKDGVLLLEESLLQHTLKDSVHFIMCGDFNARTGNKQPLIEEMSNYPMQARDDDDDDMYIKDNLSRASKDDVINNFGKSLLDFCFLFDLAILNGCCPGDTFGDFTFVSSNGSSVIDLFLASECLVNVCDLHVGDGLFSWHLPVEMSLTSINERPNVNNVILEGEEKIIWCDAYVQSYKNEQDSSHFKECLGKARSLLDVDVNGAVEQLVKSLYGAAACMIKTVGKGRQACNSWFYCGIHQNWSNRNICC